MGYDSFWVYDHLYVTNTQPTVPFMEAWSMLAALAAVTERVELGTLVTPVGMRHPAYLANVIATVDNIAGGRCIAGLGAGWMEKEFRDVGGPSTPPGRGCASCGRRSCCCGAYGPSKPSTSTVSS